LERVRKKMRPEVERGDYIMWNLWLGSWLSTASSLMDAGDSKGDIQTSL